MDPKRGPENGSEGKIPKGSSKGRVKRGEISVLIKGEGNRNTAYMKIFNSDIDKAEFFLFDPIR